MSKLGIEGLVNSEIFTYSNQYDQRKLKTETESNENN